MNLLLDSIIIFGDDLEKLKTFYSDVLGLKIIEEIPEEWILVNAGNCKIGIHRIGTEYQRSGEIKSNVKNTKLTFEIDSDIQSFRNHLIKMNVSVKEIKSFENYPYWLFDGLDPEGNVFQIKVKKGSEVSV